MMPMSIKIHSYNVRGIRDFNKRKEVFQFIKSQKCDISLLQETHCTDECQSMWKNQWGGGGLCYFSNGTSAARGVMICISRSFACFANITQVHNDNDGRCIMIKVDIEDTIDFILANIYGPNEDSPEFFSNIFQILQKQDCTSHIMGGDFNVCMDPSMDSTATTISHKKSRNLIKEYMHEQNIWDIW